MRLDDKIKRLNDKFEKLKKNSEIDEFNAGKLNILYDKSIIN